MLTLTYNEDSLEELNKREVQLFMKRLRKHVKETENKEIRFFACGEHGTKYGRPHYHIIIFGWQPKDAYFWKFTKRGERIYRSPDLEKIWTKGFSSIGLEVNRQTAKYCAKYMTKAFGDTSAFVLMSRRPMIGELEFRKQMNNIINDGVMYTDHGAQIPPRAFLRKLRELGYKVQRRFSQAFDIIEQKAMDRALRCIQKLGFNYVTKGGKRLSVTKRLTEAKASNWQAEIRFYAESVLGETTADAHLNSSPLDMYLTKKTMR